MFKRKKTDSQRKIKQLKILGFLILIINALGYLFVFLNPRKWRRFIKGEKKEIKELSGGKEEFGRFCQDSGKLIKDLFIPYDGNDHKPKSLRPKSLVAYILIAVMVKLTVVGFLFFTYPTPAELAAIVASKMIALINESRIEAGVEPLAENTNLVQFAQVKGEDMITRDYFAHDTPEGKRPWQWINRAEYDYVYAGENLAMDFTSAEVVHAAFMKSPSHRKNILNPNYKEAGIAVIDGELNGHATVLLVEFFGTQRKDLSSLASASPAGAETREIPTEETAAPGVAGQEISQPADHLPVPAAAGLNPEGVIVVTTTQKTAKALVDLVIEYSNIFFIAFLIFILISLALNVFIKIRIQHPSVILQSMVVVALLLAMILVKFHFVEQVAPHLLIL